MPQTDTLSDSHDGVFLCACAVCDRALTRASLRMRGAFANCLRCYAEGQEIDAEVKRYDVTREVAKRRAKEFAHGTYEVSIAALEARLNVDLAAEPYLDAEVYREMYVWQLRQWGVRVR